MEKGNLENRNLSKNFLNLFKEILEKLKINCTSDLNTFYRVFGLNDKKKGTTCFINDITSHLTPPLFNLCFERKNYRAKKVISDPSMQIFPCTKNVFVFLSIPSNLTKCQLEFDKLAEWTLMYLYFLIYKIKILEFSSKFILSLISISKLRIFAFLVNNYSTNCHLGQQHVHTFHREIRQSVHYDIVKFAFAD